MKHLRILTALTIGVLASTSGMIQVGATTYNYFVDFSTKEVADFTDYRQSFNTDTYDLEAVVTFTFQGTYRYNSCSTPFTQDVKYQPGYQINETGTFFILGTFELPNFVCSTSNTTYFAQHSVALPSAFIDTIMNDDANFAYIFSQMQFYPVGIAGLQLSLLGYRHFFNISYDFNTTYLFNYFLSDQQFHQRTYNGTASFAATQKNYLQYLYTTAGDDEYVINNSNTTSIGTDRVKYAVDYDDTFFRGESVGSQFDTNYTGTDVYNINQSAISNLIHYYRYYYLNVSNLAQAIVTAPLINFTDEVCSGGFLDINVGCYVNNAIAYLVNDAPIISDAFTLLNTGIELAAQTFGIIGSFSDDNVFGYLILVGFGFIAVKWFLKNDE
jgi:hypothetical protein